MTLSVRVLIQALQGLYEQEDNALPEFPVVVRVVLDPFAGSGLTRQVARSHGRDFVGIDLDERNAELARRRIGPLFLSVEHHPAREVV